MTTHIIESIPLFMMLYLTQSMLGVFMLLEFDRHLKREKKPGYIDEFKKQLLLFVNNNNILYIISISLISLFYVVFISPIIGAMSCVTIILVSFFQVCYYIGKFLMPPEIKQPTTIDIRTTIKPTIQTTIQTIKPTIQTIKPTIQTTIQPTTQDESIEIEEK